MSLLENLYNEILAAIFDCCDLSTILKVSLVSKRLRNVTLPIIFRNIDMSIHDQETLPHEILGEALLDFNRTIIPRWIEDQQCLFIQALRTNPALGKLVKRFKWTLIWPDEPSHPSFTGGEYQNLWKVFEVLDNVRDLDLAAYHYNTQAYVRESPSRLFPNAYKIRLGGVIHSALAKAILCSSVSNEVESLALNYLQDEGVDFEGRPMTEDAFFQMASSFRQSSGRRPIDGDTMGGPTWRCPGPIRGILPLVRYSSLRHLHIARPGRIQLLGDDDWSNSFFPNSLDKLVYQEYGEFLDNVRPTLETFVFEQNGVERYKKRNQASSLYFQYRAIALIDNLFRNHVLPVLSRGEWPRLKKVKVLGFGRGKDHPPLLSSQQMSSLQQNLRDVELSFCTEIAGGFDYFEGFSKHDRWKARMTAE